MPNIFRSHLLDLIVSGWLGASEAWTYASADAPTFTFTISGDKTAKYSPGMRIKLTQTTVKYFIITAVAYSAPNTTVTVYGGTDYTLVDAAITKPFYSTRKTPAGFPLDPRKWTVEVTDTTPRTQMTPTAATWYNLGGVSIIVPIGLWDLQYSVCFKGAKPSADTVIVEVTLSTGNNVESDPGFTAYQLVIGATGSLGLATTVFRRKIISLVEKTTYYINTNALLSGYEEIANLNSNSKLIIRSICAYL